MNTATQNLENDHVHILRLTDIMLEMVEQKCTETDHFELVVNVIRKFADGLQAYFCNIIGILKAFFTHTLRTI